MKETYFFNEDCFNTMNRMIDKNYKVNVILTSPPYNTNKKAGKTRTINNVKNNDGNVRYDVFVDNFDEWGGYVKWTKKLFDKFDKVLDKNGVILYNMSYGSENTSDMFLAISEIIQNTNFNIQDCIIWKKSNAFPNTCSPNKLTRITEFVFVFCRKGEEQTFSCNKEISSIRPTGQKMYKNIFNFIEAPNNDGSCNLNKATYSSELCKRLLNIYAKSNSRIYDPFMGTGTTAVACRNMNNGYICFGSELSKEQVEYSKERINKNE